MDETERKYDYELNKVEVFPGDPRACNVCGRKCKHMHKHYGRTLCAKHYRQIRLYGEPKDENPRTTRDRNEIHVCQDVAYIDLYDRSSNVIAQAIIDREDIPKVQYAKWGLLSAGYVVNNPRNKASDIYMHRAILKTDQLVEHCNGNMLDNRKCNLRVTTRSKIQMGVIHRGVYTEPNGKHLAYIKIDGRRLELGEYIDEEEALWARWYAETVLFKEFRYPKPEPFILDARKAQIKEYVDRKVQRL